jgi:hypothetical protein
VNTTDADIYTVRAVFKRANVRAANRVNEIAIAARRVVALDDDPAGDLEQEVLLDELFQLVGSVAPAWCAAEIVRLMRGTSVVLEQPATDGRTWAIALAMLLFALAVAGVTLYAILTEKPGDYGDGSVRPGTPHDGALP